MRGKKILVADGDEGVRATTGEVLELAGFDVLLAGTGAMALEILRSHRALDCCFVDPFFPDVPLENFLTELGAVVRLRGFPLVLMSGMPELGDWETGGSVVTRLRKPYDFELLLRVARAACAGS